MGPRVVAELGRPETPEETAERKAAASLAYRSSQTARNLVAALLVTLGVVLVVVLAVPRGDAAPRTPIDVAAVAGQVERARDVTVVVPTVPADWSVNGAAVSNDGTPAWTIVYGLPAASEYLRFAQAFDADDTWASQQLHGTAPGDTVEIGGVTWSRYAPADPAAAGNVTAALGTQAGDQHLLIYGAASADDLALVAASVADQVLALQQATR
ncbi:MAG: DUF4245 family protein [Microbacterium sp.]